MLEKIREIFRKYPDRCCAVIVALAAILPFLPSLGFTSFVFDDSAYVGQNYLFDLSWYNIKYHLTSLTVQLHSPLVMLSFMPDFLLWGEKLFYSGARMQNILWHCTGMILFYFILRKLKWNFKDGSFLEFPPAAAMCAAIAAAWHPQRVESVVWLAERKDVMVVALGLAAVYTFIRAYQRERIPVISPVLLFISLWGVKPMMITLPLILTLGYAVAEKRFELKKFFRLFTGLYLAVAVYVLLNLATFTKFSSGAIAGASGGNRIFAAAYNILLYFGKTLFPANLNPLYPLYGATEISPWYLVILLAVIVSLFAAALIPGHRREFLARTLLPCALMYGIAVFPVCNLKRIGNVDFADRYSYFPSLFIWAALAAVLTVLYRDYSRFRRLITVLSGVYLAVLLIMTGAYMPAWKNKTSQIDAMLNCERPHSGALKLAAVVEFEAGRLDNAILYADMLKQYGSGRDETIFVEAIHGMVEVSRGETERGIARINGFLSRPDWHYILNAPLQFANRCIMASAMWHLRRAKDPEHRRYAANLFLMAAHTAGEHNQVQKLNYEGVSMMISGNYAEAEKRFIQALRFVPDDQNILKNLEAVRRKIKSAENKFHKP